MTRLLGPPLTDAERELVRVEARFMLGTPWRHKGRTQRGVDCVGLPWLVLNRVISETRGIKLPKPADDYGRRPFNRRLQAELTGWLGAPVPIERADIVTMAWGGDAHHVGIVVPHHFYPFALIHADNTAAGGPRVVEHGVDARWRSCILEGWRL
jgi:cell wall-associated NlpC family hydrolase